MNRLKDLRLALGWNMKKAAEEIGIPYTTYVGYEKGEREPNSEMLIKLADFFGCSIEYLLGRSDKAQPDIETELEDAMQLLRDRADLRAMLHAGARRKPETVQKITELFESMNEG